MNQPWSRNMSCLAESDGPSLHCGTHICRHVIDDYLQQWGVSGPHDKHRCAVCGYCWPRSWPSSSDTDGDTSPA